VPCQATSDTATEATRAVIIPDPPPGINPGQRSDLDKEPPQAAAGVVLRAASNSII